MTRDSILLIVGVLAGLVLFLTGTKPFMEWGYYDWLAAAGYVLSVVSAQLGSSPLKGKTKPDSIADPNRLGIGVFLAVFLLAGQTGCASAGGPKHVLTTADTALYESIKAISAAEITLTSAGVLSPDQSREINKKLLPVARTGKELNDVLSTWNGKAPLPKEIPKLVKELSDLLLTVSAVIPDSPAKASLVEAIARAQQAALALTLLIGG
jgi:hypothetical protein